MTRYYVDISCDLLEGPYKVTFPEGFRFISRFGPRTEYMERWLVEDDDAPEELEDFLVCPYMQKADDGTVTITDRRTRPLHY